MSDILKVTQPLIGADNIGKVRPQSPSQTQVPNIPDPSRVTKANQQNVFSDGQQGQFNPNLSSNFDFFMQMLKNTPTLCESFSQLALFKMGTAVSSGIDSGFAAELSQFMDLMKMDQSQLLAFLQTQASTGTKFSGPIFDALRKVLAQNPSDSMKNTILEFVRTFDNASANGHLTKNIMSNLQSIASRIPTSQRTFFLELVNKLIAPTANGQAASDTVQTDLTAMLKQSIKQGSGSGVPQFGSNINNLNVLKTEIFPFLSKYMSATRDFGPIRDTIANLTLNLVKYENGTADNLLSSFEKLMAYPQISRLLKGFSSEQINSMLLNSNFTSSDTKLIDAFIQLINSGVKGDGDASSKEVFEDVLKSVLINKSVYMPLQHMIIPANINGKMFFSEIWADPDADNSFEQGDENPASKFLIKFDIEEVGFFELVMLYKEGRISMLLFCPPAFEAKQNDIKHALGQIMKNNGIVTESLSVEKATVPLLISDVFPQIYERKDTINVKV